MDAPTPIRARLFPSRVALPDGTVHEGVLTLVGLDRVWFYQNGNKLVGDSPYMLIDLWGGTREGYGMLIDNHQEIRVTRSVDCGCGSKYKGGQNPFGIRLIMSPLPKTRSVGV